MFTFSRLLGDLCIMQFASTMRHQSCLRADCWRSCLYGWSVLGMVPPDDMPEEVLGLVNKRFLLMDGGAILDAISLHKADSSVL